MSSQGSSSKGHERQPGRSITKRYAPRSKTGCLTCRIRRVKCDEGLPFCGRCRSTGRQCDGYSIRPESRCERATYPIQACDGLGLMTIKPQTLVQSDEDNRAREFFQVQTITQWTEFFKSDLWDRYVLQLSLTEPSLHHAKLALGAMHRSLTTDGASNEYRLFAIRQYNKAISYVVRPERLLPTIVILVACWMFSCFEVMQGDHESLGRHLTSGLQMMSSGNRVSHGKLSQEQGLGTIMENGAIQECLLQQFSLLDLQMIMYEPGWVPSSIKYFARSAELLRFTSMSQARHHLTASLLRMMEIKRLEMRQVACNPEEPPSILRKRRYVLDCLEWWSVAFESFLRHERRTQADGDVRASQLLRIQHLAGCIHLSVTPWDGEASYDRHLSKFQTIVSLSQTLLEPEMSNSKRPRTKRFRYEHGVIPSLYLAGYKCRDPVVRREAHRQLSSMKTKEGVWDSDLVSKVVGHIITMEEGNRIVCSSIDIPEEDRVWREYVNADGSSEHSKAVFEFRLNGGNVTSLVERSLG